MQIKYFYLFILLLSSHFIFCQNDEIKLGNKSTNKSDAKKYNQSLFIKLYPTNLLRGEYSIGLEKSLSRYFSIEPAISTSLYNLIEHRINNEADFSENSYYDRINYQKENVRITPALGSKISIKYFKDEHADLDGFYYAIGFGYLNTKMKQTVTFLPNNFRQINVHEYEYKITRGANIMSKKNRNVEFAFGVGLRHFKFNLEEVESIYDPITFTHSTEHITYKLNYWLPTFIFNLNFGFEIKKKFKGN